MIYVSISYEKKTKIELIKQIINKLQQNTVKLKTHEAEVKKDEMKSTCT